MHALRDILDQAEKKGVAIGHFNVTDLVSLKAVFGAAQELKVPVLVGVSYCNGSLSESVVGGGIGGRLSLNAPRSSSSTGVPAGTALPAAGVMADRGFARCKPQLLPRLLRFVSLCECGPHAILAVRMGAYRSGENTMAAEVVGHLKPGMLCLADRMYSSFALWQKAVSTGAHLL